MKFSAALLAASAAFPLALAGFLSDAQIVLPGLTPGKRGDITGIWQPSSAGLSRRAATTLSPSDILPIRRGFEGQTFNLMTRANEPDPFGIRGGSRISNRVVSYPIEGFSALDDQMPTEVLLMTDQIPSTAELDDHDNLMFLEYTQDGPMAWALDLGFLAAATTGGFGNVTRRPISNLGQRSLSTRDTADKGRWYLEDDDDRMYLASNDDRFDTFIVCDVDGITHLLFGTKGRPLSVPDASMCGTVELVAQNLTNVKAISNAASSIRFGATLASCLVVSVALMLL